MVEVTDETRTALWHVVQDSARWRRYYGTLADRYHRREVWVRSVLMLSVLSSIVTLLSSLPAPLQALAGIVAAAAITFDFVTRPSQTAAVLGLIRDECSQTRAAAEALWLDLPTVSEDEARRRLNHLRVQLEYVTGQDPVPEDAPANLDSTKAAFQELASTYGNAN